MRVAELIKPGEIRLREGPAPVLEGKNRALVQVKAVGICGTDLHIFQEGRADVQLPRVMGHELCGVVGEVSGDVTHIAPGDRVVLDPVFACGECDVCKAGHGNVCAGVRCFGVQMDGAFQDVISVPADQLYKVPDGVNTEQAALAEPFSIAANITARLDPQPGQRMVITGGGTIGLTVLQAAKNLGAAVLVGDIEDEKLAIAKQCGADLVVNSCKEDLAAKVEAFSPGGADLFVEAVGTSKLLEQAVAMTRPTGKIAVIGFDSSPAAIKPVDITKKELTLIGSRMNCRRFPTVIRWLEEGKLKLDPMITKRYRLEEIQTAFEDTVRDSGSSIKTLILFE